MSSLLLFICKVLCFSSIFSVSSLQLKTNSFGASRNFAMEENNVQNTVTKAGDDQNVLGVVSDGQNSGGQNPPNLPPKNTEMPSHAQPKPPTFSGQNFKRWGEQMVFYLTTLNLQRFLTDEPPTVQPDGAWD